MSRRKQSNRPSRRRKREIQVTRRKNKTLFLEVLRWFAPEGELFTKQEPKVQPKVPGTSRPRHVSPRLAV